MKDLVLRALGGAAVAALLASCGDGDVCTRPGGGCPPIRDYQVTVSVTSIEELGALQFDLTYLGDEGEFLAAGDRVECVALVDSILAANPVGEHTTKVGLISLAGISTPAQIVRCRFRSTERLRTSDFAVEVTDAADPEANSVRPFPDVEVSSVEQYDEGPDDPAPAYDVTFAIESPGRFGALQMDIAHLGNSGGFIGAGDKVECVSLVDAIVASNYLGERTTKVGLISLQGIATPAAILRCGFRTRENLAASDFEVVVTDASDTASKQIVPPPDVIVSSITARDPD